MLTSEAIERKLPTVGTYGFTELTCHALLGLVLRACSQRAETDQKYLGDLAREDALFAQWLSRSTASGPLAEALVRDATWRDGGDAAERLWDASNVAVRLQSLEQRFEGELAERQREAIYHFAYGLSHELNNPLANIATRAGVLAHRESALERRQMLETIIDNAMRGSEMLGDLMLLARPPNIEPQAVPLADWLAGLLARCNLWATPRGVRLSVVSSVVSQLFRFDPVAIAEALWCIVRNAIEASAENGTVAISLEETEGELRLSVCDSGPGLSEAALKHCFDPYFSGREAGRGLGLGLSKALMIATRHGGTVRLRNLAAGGCEATLFLPTT